MEEEDEKEFKLMQDRVVNRFGGIRKTMDVFLKDLEEAEMFEICAEVKAAMIKYDAGDEKAFDEFTK